MSNAAASPQSIFVPDWSFAEKFRKARKISGMEQREFAASLGLTSSTVASYETGRSAPRFRDAAGLAKRIQMLTSIDYRWFLDTPGDGGVGPAGIEPTTSTVEGARLLPFPGRTAAVKSKTASVATVWRPLVVLSDRRAV